MGWSTAAVSLLQAICHVPIVALATVKKITFKKKKREKKALESDSLWK